MFYILITVLILIVLSFIVKSVTKPRNYPPGPSWYPYFGSSGAVKLLSKKHGSQWAGFSQLAKNYATKVLGLKLGRDLVVVVYGLNNLKQVYSAPEFVGRPDSFFVQLRCLGKKQGITFADGELWREHRQFVMKHLKNVGFGKTLMEREIQNELQRIVDYFVDSDKDGVSPKIPLASAVMNVLWKYVAGERIKEERLSQLLHLLHERSKAFSMAGGWLNEIPWIRFIFPVRSGYTLITDINGQIKEIIQETILKHKNKEVGTDDFIYAFLKEMQFNEESYKEEQLTAICLDMLIAGSQTSSNVIEFAFLTLLRDKEIQRRVYDEIQNVIGDKTPEWGDSHRLIYTTAFLQEIQRYYTIVPLAGPRRVLEDTTIDGNDIPKGTTIIMANGDLHFDNELWENPEQFKPERFISNGELVNFEQFIPFGLGRRRCPGDTLAKSFIFITFVGIVQRFEITSATIDLPSDKPVIGILAAPQPYRAKFVPRVKKFL